MRSRSLGRTKIEAKTNTQSLSRLIYFLRNKVINTLSLQWNPVTTEYIYSRNLSSYFFQDLLRTYGKRKLRSQSSATIAAMSAERNSSPFSVPPSQYSAILVACLPGGSECSFCMKLKQGSSSAAGAGTEQERGTGITWRRSFTCSHAYEGWLPSVNLSSSRLVSMKAERCKYFFHSTAVFTYIQK